MNTSLSAKFRNAVCKALPKMDLSAERIYVDKVRDGKFRKVKMYSLKFESLKVWQMADIQSALHKEFDEFLIESSWTKRRNFSATPSCPYVIIDWEKYAAKYSIEQKRS